MLSIFNHQQSKTLSPSESYHNIYTSRILWTRLLKKNVALLNTLFSLLWSLPFSLPPSHNCQHCSHFNLQPFRTCYRLHLHLHQNPQNSTQFLQTPSIIFQLPQVSASTFILPESPQTPPNTPKSPQIPPKPPSRIYPPSYFGKPSTHPSLLLQFVNHLPSFSPCSTPPSKKSGPSTSRCLGCPPARGCPCGTQAWAIFPFPILTFHLLRPPSRKTCKTRATRKLSAAPCSAS